ncbi:MAG: type III-A CRISPR-associated RAMP protein Csm3 [bacterium]|nr:type III-A CRISPR-associated RAMP protein Csm3 [bacterium]
MLTGKVIISGCIKVITGLRIGGSSGGLKIGGIDLNVITDPEGKPYIPGSSLKGKLRSLIEKKEGEITSEKVHYCKDKQSYEKCRICKVWGISPTEKDINIDIPVYTRLIIRDVPLFPESITEEMHKNIDLQWTEVKVENVINRVKGSAESPRQIERVPAGAIFKPMEMIFNVFEETDKELLKVVFEAMELLEDDYLGGMGSRGYGKVKFENIEVYWNKKEDYENGNLNQNKINNGFTIPSEIVKNFSKIINNLK